MPPAMGVLPPERPVAAPRGVTESPSSRLTASAALSPSRFSGKTATSGRALDLRGGVVTVDEEILPFMVDVFGSDLLPEMIDDGFGQHETPPGFTELNTERDKAKETFSISFIF